LRGFHDLDEVCLSLPRIVGRAGIEQPLPIPTTVDEEAGLTESAERIHSVVRGIRLAASSEKPAEPQPEKIVEAK
jgi:L-lactate dehydrogenase